MVQSSSFIIELIEKIGVPFVGAIETVSIENKLSDAESAKLMAQMLGQAVQTGIAVSESITMPEDVAEADSVRLALATLTGTVVADFHRHHKRLPEATDIERIVKSLQAVLPFAENFSGATEHSSRLALLGKDTLIFDDTQIGLVMAQIMTPVMGAIAEFPFGQSEAKLLQDVVTKLQTYASDFAKLSGDGSKLGEIMVLKSMANIYAECHRGETERLTHANDATRANLSIDSVWSLFDKRITMLELIAGLSDPRRTEQTSTAATDNVNPEPVSTVTPPVTTEPAVSTPPPATPPVAPPPVTQSPPVQATPVSQAATPAGANPMGFFAAKKDNQGASVPQNVPPPTTQPPAQNAAEATPVAPPTAPVETASSSESTDSNAPVNPMGFFKPGAKKDE